MARRPARRPFVRRYAPLLVAGVAVLVIVGLRTDDDIGFDLGDQLEQESSDTTGRSTTSTTSDETPSTETLPTTAANPVLSDPEDAPESLRRALLTDADLPGGWSPTELGDQSTAVCPGQDPAAEVTPEHALKAGFAGGPEGPFLTSVVGEFDGDDGADDYLDAFEGALDDCDGLEDDNGLTYEVERTQDVDLGDRSVTASVRVAREGQEVRVRLLAVRVGDRIATMALAATGESDASVAVEALETVVRRLAH